MDIKRERQSGWGRRGDEDERGRGGTSMSNEDEKRTDGGIHI